MKRELPLGFMGSMVLEILADRKTETRRPYMKPFCHDAPSGKLVQPIAYRRGGVETPTYHRSLPCAPGDILYVKETYADTEQAGYHRSETWYVYRADDPDWETMEGWKWKSGMLMPRVAARTFLEVLSINIEPLCEITTAGARADGFATRSQFLDTFQKIYPDCTLESPVLVRKFKRLAVYPAP
jgi:hypothetical protein